MGFSNTERYELFYHIKIKKYSFKLYFDYLLLLIKGVRSFPNTHKCSIETLQPHPMNGLFASGSADTFIKVCFYSVSLNYFLICF